MTAKVKTKVIALQKSFLETFTDREFDTAAFKCVWDHIDKTYRRDKYVPIDPKTIDFLDIVAESKDAPVTLAGGSVVRYLLGKGEWNSDFDFWCSNGPSRQAFRKFLDPYRNKEAYEMHSHTYKFPIGGRNIKLQSVDAIQASLAEVFNSFDISACQFAYIGGEVIYTTELAWADFLNRKLRLLKWDNPKYTKNRVMKYMDMGFKPDMDTVKFLLDSTTGKLGEVEVQY